MFKKLYILLIVLSVTFAACSKENAGNKVVYRVTLESQWSADTYPDAFPNEAGLSPFLAFSHADYIELFNTESLASPGLKAMAENGSINPLDQEVQQFIDAGNAADLVTSTRISSPGIATTELTVTQESSTVSLVSKITPSPDWFIATKNIQLYEDGEWVDKIESVTIFDAGTIVGSDFYAPSTPRTTPNEVSELTIGPLISENTSILATVRFERVE